MEVAPMRPRRRRATQRATSPPREDNGEDATDGTSLEEGEDHECHVSIKDIPLNLSAKELQARLGSSLDRVVERVRIKGFLYWETVTVTATDDPGTGADGDAVTRPEWRRREDEHQAMNPGLGHVVRRLAWQSEGEGTAKFLISKGVEEALEQPVELLDQTLRFTRHTRARRKPAAVVSSATLELGFFQDPSTFAPLWRSRPECVRVELEIAPRERRLRLLVDPHAARRGIRPWLEEQAQHHTSLAANENGINGQNGHSAPERALPQELEWRRRPGPTAQVAPAPMHEPPPLLNEYRCDFLLRDLEVLGTRDLGRHYVEGGGGKGGGLRRYTALLLWVKTPPRVFTRSCMDDVFQDVSVQDKTAGFPDEDNPWSRTGDFTGGALGVCRALLVVAQLKGRLEIHHLLDTLKENRGAVRFARCSDWGLADLDELQFREDPFVPPPPLRLTPFAHLTPSFFPGKGARPLPFDALYLLTALVQNRVLPPSTITPALYDCLAKSCDRGEDGHAQCIDALVHFLNYRLPAFNPIDSFRRVTRARQDLTAARVPPSVRAVPRGFCRVRRLLITPLGAECRPPSVELPNRVLRHFSSHGLDHHFLRVSFTEEALDSLNSYALLRAGSTPDDPRGNDLYHRVLSLVTDGFELAGQRFRFLASSASQMREQSAWFVAEDPAAHQGMSVVGILAWMGSFSSIKNIAKYTARLGQSFSAHFCSIPLSQPLPLHPTSPHPTPQTPPNLIPEASGESAGESSQVESAGSTGEAKSVSVNAVGDRGSGEVGSEPVPVTARLVPATANGEPAPATFVASVEKIPDVERDGHCFTDGIGRISPELAAAITRGELAPHLEELDDCPLEPTAFQIRYAGAKGVVAVWPRDLLYPATPAAHLQHIHTSDSTPSSAEEGPSMAPGALPLPLPLPVEELRLEDTDKGEGERVSGSGSRAGEGSGAPAAHLCLRPSMIKFDSERSNLEIVNWGRFMPGFLNRQIITLLSNLGVPDQVFLDMQEDVVRRLDRALGDAEQALQLLTDTGEDGSYSSALAMLRAGVDPQREPHLRHMLLAIRELQLLELKEKARIFVRDGRWLIGVVDELGVLEYGQCFVQVSTPTSWGRAIQPWVSPRHTPGDPASHSASDPAPHSASDPASHSASNPAPAAAPGVPQGPAHHAGAEGSASTGTSTGTSARTLVVEGRIVFGKNPCLHPGDLRILEAVDRPELRHLVNCVVLPQKGKMPHASEASGSDMDGDVYFVSWDARLVPQRDSDDPMDYQAMPREEESVTMEAVHRFFVDQMLNVNVGIICNAHVVHADLSGASSEACKELAKQAALAIDFAKTGVPGVMPPRLKPEYYPDFMEKEDKEMYESRRVLGQLYRRIKGLAEGADSLGRTLEAAPPRPDPGSPGRTGDGEPSGLSGTSVRMEAVRRGRGALRLAGHRVEDVAGAYNPSLLRGIPDSALQPYLESARRSKMRYDRGLLEIMHSNNIVSEEELLTGSFVFLSKSNRGRAAANKERVRMDLRALRREFLFLLLHGKTAAAAKGAPRSPPLRGEGAGVAIASADLDHRRLAKEDLERAKIRAAAWYFVTYKESEILRRQRAARTELRDLMFHGSAPILLSFAWIGVDLLASAPGHGSNTP